jgi:hypothetical protein
LFSESCEQQALKELATDRGLALYDKKKEVNTAEISTWQGFKSLWSHVAF